MTRVKTDDSVPKRAREVLEYFLRHPQAADSLEGVARWRRQEGTIQDPADETQKALRWLVQHGFLRERRTPGAAPIFTLDENRRSEASRFLHDVKLNKD